MGETRNSASGKGTHPSTRGQLAQPAPGHRARGRRRTWRARPPRTARAARRTGTPRGPRPAPACAMSRPLLTRRGVAPLPWETRLTVMPSASAAASTTLPYARPLDTGISTRNAAPPSGKEGSWSWPVTPRPPNTSPTRLIRPLPFSLVRPNELCYSACRKSSKRPARPRLRALRDRVHVRPGYRCSTTGLPLHQTSWIKDGSLAALHSSAPRQHCGRAPVTPAMDKRL